MKRLAVAAAMLGLVLAGCGASTPSVSQPAKAPASSGSHSTPAAAPAALTPVTVRLAWTVGGYDTPLILAKKKGFYKQAGLDVTIQQGKGSLSTAESVAAGHDTFGYCDAGTTASLIEKGAKMQMVADYVQQTPFSFIYRQGIAFSTPADLKGKTVVTGGGGIGYTFLYAALQKYGLTKQDVHVEVAQASSYPSILQTAPDAIVLGYSTSDYPAIKAVTPSATFKSFADFGISAYNIGLTTSLNEISQSPQVVAAFVKATDEGWSYAIKHPHQAAAAGAQAFPPAKASILLAGLTQSIPLLHTPATEGHPYGWMAKSDWEAGVKALGIPTTAKPVTDLFTDRFIPAQ